MSEQNKKLVRQFFDEVWNHGNYAIIDERVVSDYVGNSFTTIHGPEGAKQYAATMHSAFPDFHYAVEDEISEADKVIHRWTAKGTHQGAFQGIPPTSEKASISGISIFRVADGKIVEGWTTVDLLGLLKQLGGAPAPAQA